MELTNKKKYWFEVYKDLGDDDGTETIANFDTKKECIDFIYDYSLRYPNVELGYDEWMMNEDGSGVEKIIQK